MLFLWQQFVLRLFNSTQDLHATLEIIHVATTIFLPQICSMWGKIQSLFHYFLAKLVHSRSCIKNCHKTWTRSNVDMSRTWGVFWKERKSGCSMPLAAVAQCATPLAQPLRNSASCQIQIPLMKKVKEAWVLNKATDDNAILLLTQILAT